MAPFYATVDSKSVATKTLLTGKEWIKWLGPVARLSSLLLAGLAVPLDADAGRELGESIKVLELLGSFADGKGGMPSSGPEGRRELRQFRLEEGQLHCFHKLLQDIGLDPRQHGMALAQTANGRWLWVTAEEARSMERPDAVL